MGINLKFRVWCVLSKKWINDKFFIDEKGVVYSFENGNLKTVENGSKLIYFSTSQLDSNNDEIFIGDIIKYYAKELLICFSPWEGVCLKTLNEPFLSNFDYDQTSLIFEKDKIEVIGNIHQNEYLLRELLK